MVRFLQISNNSLFIFYLVSNLINLGLLIVAIYKNTIHQYRLEGLRVEGLRAFAFYSADQPAGACSQRRDVHCGECRFICCDWITRDWK